MSTYVYIYIWVQITVSKKVEFNYQALVSEKSFVVDFGSFDRIHSMSALTRHLFEPYLIRLIYMYLEESTQ